MDLLSSFPMAAPDGGSWQLCRWLDGSLYPDGAVGLPRIVDPSVALANSYVSYLLEDSLKVLAHQPVEARENARRILLGFNNGAGEGVVFRVEERPTSGAGELRLVCQISDGLTRLAGALGALDFEAFVARHGNSPVGLSRNQIIGDRGAVGAVAHVAAPTAERGA